MEHRQAAHAVARRIRRDAERVGRDHQLAEVVQIHGDTALRLMDDDMLLDNDEFVMGQVVADYREEYGLDEGDNLLMQRASGHWVAVEVLSTRDIPNTKKASQQAAEDYAEAQDQAQAADFNDLLPWHHTITAVQEPSAQSSANLFPTTSGTDVGNTMRWQNTATPAVGNWLAYDTPLSEGTWHLTVAIKRNNNGGIFQCSVDGSNVGSAVDGYASGTLVYALVPIGSFVVASAGLKRIKMEVTGKNASAVANGYYIIFQGLILRRTA